MRKVLVSLGVATLVAVALNLQSANGQQFPGEGASQVPEGLGSPGSISLRYGDVIRAQTEMITQLTQRMKALEERVAKLEAKLEAEEESR